MEQILPGSFPQGYHTLFQTMRRGRMPYYSYARHLEYIFQDGCNLDIVRFLVQSGADVNVIDYQINGNTPLKIAYKVSTCFEFELENIELHRYILSSFSS